MTLEACLPIIVGRGRSGTTLLRSMLDSHPVMAVPHESHFMLSLALKRRGYETSEGFEIEKYLRDLFSHYGFIRWGLAEDQIAAAFRTDPPGDYSEATRRVYSSYARQHGKCRYGEKTPGFVMHIPLLAALFPESRFVHVIRDGRNVALSYLAAGWGPKDLEEAAIYWRRFVRRGQRDGEKLGPQRYLEIRYEKLIEDPEASLRKVCDFVEVEFDPVMLQYFDRPELRAIARGHPNLSLPPTRGLRDWRIEMNRQEVAVFELLAGELLEELGYERVTKETALSVFLRAGRGWTGMQVRRASRRARKVSRAWQPGA